MRKIIKKIVNLLGWLSLSALLLLIALSMIVNSPKAQEYITEKVFGKLQHRLGNSISYSKIKITVFNKVEFTNLFITDQKGDTIIYAPNMRAGFPGLMRKILFHRETPFRLGSLVFNNSIFRYSVDSTGVSNIQFIIDSLGAPKDTSGRPAKPTFIDKIKIKNSQFTFLKPNAPKRNFGIDFGRMVFNNLNANVSDMVFRADTVNFSVENLSFKEKSGFEVTNVSSDFSYSKKYIHFDNFTAITPVSAYQLEKIHFDYDSSRYFASDKLYTDINLGFIFKNSKIYLDELKYFVKLFDGMHNLVDCSGKFTGTFSNLRCKDLAVEYGTGTSLKGKFDLTGWPDNESTFLIFDIKKFVTTTNDMLSFELPGSNKIKLPERFSSVTNWDYSGNFTGFFRDFVSYGVLNTNLGSLKTDILFKPDSSNRVTFSGRLSGNGFNIGELAGSPNYIGNITFDMKIDGLGHIDKGFDVDLDGDISEFVVNDYAYKNINVDGLFTQNKFNGKLNIDDENLKMDFDGLVDLSSKQRQYKFLANILHANFYNLNLDKTDPNFTGSFLVDADITGNSLDEINGNVKLLNSFFTKTDAQIQVYDLDMSIQNNSVQNKINLTSDFADAEIAGHFKISQLANEYYTLINQLIPALSDSTKGSKLTSQCDFNYKVDFKNCIPVLQFFMPNISIEPKTLISGDYKRTQEVGARIHVQSPGLNINRTSLDDLVINSSITGKGMDVDFGCRSLNLANKLDFENITIESLIDSNHADYTLRWLNWDSSVYKGKLSGNLDFLNKPGELARVQFLLDSSDVIINDSLWSLSPFTLLKDSSSVLIKNFALWHGKEFVRANGKLSEDIEHDSILCRFNTFDFSNVNKITHSTTFMFGGILDGDAVIKGYKSPLFFASLFVKGFSLNGEIIGDTYIDSHWQEEQKAIKIEANAMRDSLNTLNMTGNYYPKGSLLDFQLNLNKLRMEILSPFLKSMFSDIRGMATGLITAKGTLFEPLLNGELNLQKAKFTVDYLKARYNFTSKLTITNNNIVFDNVAMYDVFGNTASLNGIIKTEYFRKYYLNLTINTNKFLCLNTTAADNVYFYGTAFGTGVIRIYGESSTLKFDVNSRAEAGTVFNIPVSETEELADYSFIKYVDDENKTSTKVKEEYKVNLLGYQLDFNIKITPDAVVKIVFDPTVGDVMEGKGSGDMRISINTIGDFKIIGDYVIESGNYLFTLPEFFINRKFIVEPGSTLRWSGDPINADVDIKTYLTRKASLQDLDPDLFANYSSNTVNCIIGLTGKLMQPTVNYDLEFPYAEQELKDKVNSVIVSDEEKGKQFLSLMIMEKFLPAGNSTGAKDKNTNIGGVDIGKANAADLLTNQLNNWLSQINIVDIGVNIKPGTENSSQELGVILGKQLFNNRLSINGSIDRKTYADAEKASSIVGDVDIEYKLTKSGRLRTRVYNRASENNNTTTGSTGSVNDAYTQGAGVFYTEEFDNLSELAQRYRDALKPKNKKKKEETKNGDNNREATKMEEELQK